MKNFKRILSLFSLSLLPVWIWAQAVVTENTVNASAEPEAHIFATFVKSFDHNLKLTIEEEIRSAPTHRSHTTVALTYAPLDYLNIFAGYTVKLYGNQGWTDPNKYIRHRANVLLTAHTKVGQWSLSLREGVMLDARADEIDTREKNKVDFTLRSRLQAVYSIPNTPLSIVGKMEMLNALNAPTKYLNSVDDNNWSSFYVSELRPELGLQWKINKANSLSLTYRYNYIYGRDIRIEDSGDVSVTHKYTPKHLLLLSYKLDW